MKFQSAKGKVTASRPGMVGWLPTWMWAVASRGQSVSPPSSFSYLSLGREDPSTGRADEQADRIVQC